ncbi:MAG: hypothetical protein Ct9H90mP5_06690 [Acidimicrobiaceae bacterium]|nr:MAG: hypothetical protein Ct9H90mP5_06690 [Acidimicrobiaceae bacterium]
MLAFLDLYGQWLRRIHYEKQSYGRIVNLCSLNGVNAHRGTVEYNSAKEALRSATRTAAREWAPLELLQISFAQLRSQHLFLE